MVLAALSHRAARETAGVEKQKLFQSKCHHRPCLRLTDRALTTTTHAFVLLAGRRHPNARGYILGHARAHRFRTRPALLSAPRPPARPPARARPTLPAATTAA